MKIALVHDYIKEYGGAERVLEALHEIWPEAPIFTTVYLPKFLGPHRERFEGKLGELGKWDIRTSFFQYLPFKAKLISPFRIIAPFVFRSFDLSKFDVVIVSATGAYSPNIIKVKSQKSPFGKLRVMVSGVEPSKVSSNYTLDAKRYFPIHICYCHTPPRYLYGYATAREWKKNVVLRVVGELANHFLRLIDYKSAQNVDYFIANSKNVAGRIKKFYRKSSTVIYPPAGVAEVAHKNFLGSQMESVDSSHKRIVHSATSENFVSSSRLYYLCGGRLAKPKNIGLIVKTCTKLNLPLKIFGKAFAGYGEALKSLAGPTVEFLGEISDEEKMELMRNAKAYIFASEDEDFGITPVEAMSCGTPVIAYRSGGVIESILEGETGIFFDQLSVGSLIKAMKQLNNLIINPVDCFNQAQKFSKERFKKEIKEFVGNKYAGVTGSRNDQARS